MTTVHLLRPLRGPFLGISCPTAPIAALLLACAAWGSTPAAAAPTVTLAASPASVPYGGSTTLTWSSTQAGSCSIPWGSQATSGSYTTPGLFSSVTYTVTCYGPGGAQSGSATVSVSGPPPAPSVSVVADPAVVPFNGSSTLSWASNNATACNTPWGATATSGSYTTPPVTYDRAFTVTCSGYGGSNAATAFVRIGSAAPLPPPAVTLTANPAAVAYGGGSTLSWTSSNASGCSTPWGSNAVAGSFASAGLLASTTFTVTCSGSGGSGSASATVTVAAAPPPTPVPPAPTVQLSANPASVAYGATTTLSWTSTNASTCTTPWGATATSGSSTTPPLTASTTYPVSCTGAGGSQTASAAVTVGPQPSGGGLTLSFTATPAAVAYGASTTLAWAATGATACSLPWGGSATSGSYATPALFGATTYSITCYGPAGSRSALVDVAVSGPPPAPVVGLTADPAVVAINGTSLVSWTSTNATACNTPWGATATGGAYTTPAITYDRTFTVTCSGYGGSGSASVSVQIGRSAPTPTPSPAPTPTPTPTPTPSLPTVTLNANPASVAFGATTTLTWSSTDATTCTTPWGATASSGSYTTPALTATATYTVACTGAGGSGAAQATVTVAPQVAESDPPIVFNASTSARPGDVVSLQGHNFGDSPFVALTSAPAVALEIVNRVGTSWLAVQIPANAQGELTVRVRNATGTSAPVKLNGAIAHHLDAIQIVPGGAFRIFGRNLLLAGSTPIVRVGGIVAGVNLLQSNEHMLVATAPAALTAAPAAVITVDNGNGSGPAQLDRSIAIVATAAGAGDPFALGVGWAAGFADLATRVIDAATDARLSPKVQCNGSSDDSPAIQQAIQLAGSSGGGVVRLPAGRCRVAGGMNMQSKVVVEGAGKALTELLYESNYPVFGVGLDLVGIRNLTLTNAGPAREGPLLKQSTRVVVQNVRVALGTSSQMYLDGNRNIVVAGCDFLQAGSVSHQGPYILNGSAGLVFQNNTTQWVDGAPAFGRVQDSLIQGNRFTRDGRTQNAQGTVHSLTIDFAHRIAVVGNTFDVAYGPITNKTRNDGETILTEAGGAVRTENLGSVASATAMTLSDPNNTLLADPFGNGYAPENYGIAIVAGKGAGQTRRMVAYAHPVATIERPWDVVPDSTSRYASFVWGLEKSLIKDNQLSQNPRGIWLYHAAVRDVDIVGNQISEGGGIYLRSYQNLGAKSFMPIYNVLVANNTVSNTTKNWMSYINAVFVNSDARAFGIANLGLEVRRNRITGNVPNQSSQTEEYANTEGFMNMMRVENYGGYESSPMPRMLGSILQGNTCTTCDVAVRVGTGAGGTTVLGTQLVNTPALWTDWATTSTPEKSTGTVVR